MKLLHAFNILAMNQGVTSCELAKRCRISLAVANEWVTRLGPLGVYSEYEGRVERLYFDKERWK